MDITINTPALLFPAISLIMLAYTNRFLALANVIRQLHERYQKKDENSKILLHAQIKNLKYRLRLIKNMQIMGVLAFVSCILCMFFIYNQWVHWASVSFAIALILFCVSLALSLFELISSTKSLEIELSDMQDIDESIVDNLKRMMKE
jgi:uncharacterized Tic20 family protein